MTNIKDARLTIWQLFKILERGGIYVYGNYAQTFIDTSLTDGLAKSTSSTGHNYLFQVQIPPFFIRLYLLYLLLATFTSSFVIIIQKIA